MNSVNFGHVLRDGLKADPIKIAQEFLRGIPGERIVYAHMAGHYQQAPDLLIDTHGADVIDSVWALLEEAYQLFGAFPTCLERDNNIPPLSVLMREVNKIADFQQLAKT